MSSPKSEFDTPWKDILDIYFEQFIAYCWPERHSEIDWNHGYKSLDKELSKIDRGAPIGNRIVAKLINKVKLIKWLYGRGWKKDDVLTLLTFIDWVFALPPLLEIKCRKEIELIEEEMHVNYVTSWERMGIQTGIQMGIQKGESSL